MIMRFYRKISATSFLLLGKSSQSFFFPPLPITKYINQQRIISRASSTTDLYTIDRDKIPQVKTTSELVSAIQEAWNSGETDGVLKLADQFNVLQHFSVMDVTEATLLSIPVKGHVAGIMNSWIGSCCQMKDKDAGAGLAWELLNAYDTMLEDLQPDMVTLSLVYSTMMQAENNYYHTLGKETLERAQRLAKKEGGTRWRKSVTASKRKKAQRALDVCDELNKLYGISILHESDDELIVSKPSGMVCFHKHMTTSGKFTKSRRKKQKMSKNDDDDNNNEMDAALENILLNNGVPLSSLNIQARGIVHRLDRGTSGCMVLAKTNERHAELVTQFFLRQVEKSYDTLAQRTEATKNKLKNAGEINIPVYGRPAISFYEVKEQYTSTAASDEVDIFHLRIRTKTGRRHQVRVHCAEGLGMPIINDSKYINGGSNNNTEKESNRFCLHASTLNIPGIPLIESPTPEWWDEEIQRVKSL